MSWLLRVLVGFDQMINAIANGNPDETISSRVARNAVQGQRLAIALEGLIDCIFAVGIGVRHHCQHSIERTGE